MARTSMGAVEYTVCGASTDYTGISGDRDGGL